MEVSWREIISKTNAIKHLEQIAVSRISLDIQKRNMKVIFESGVLLEAEDIDDIAEAFIAEHFTDMQMSVSFFYPEHANDFTQKFEEIMAYIKRRLLTMQPSLLPFFPYIRFLLQDNTLLVELPGNAAVSIWNNARCSLWLEQFLSSAFSQQLKMQIIKVDQEISLKPVNEDAAMPFRRENVKRPSAASTKTASPVEAISKKDLIYGEVPRKKGTPVSIDSLVEESGKVAIEGCIIKVDTKETYDGSKKIILFNVSDYTSTVCAKIVMDKKSSASVLDRLVVGKRLHLNGSMYIDKYTHELTLDPKYILELPSQERMDNAQEKRVELHLHTQLSTLDSMLSVKDAIGMAAQWGHSAVAITDHGVVQSFPDAYGYAKKAGIKLIYGMEGYFVDDYHPVSFDDPFVVFDIETTGLNPKVNHITQIGAVKLKNGLVIDRFESLVNPNMTIPREIVELTGITDEMVANAPDAQSVLPKFFEFAKGCHLVAHNIKFDASFICEHGRRFGIDFDRFLCVDTLMLSRYNLRDLKRHRLNDITAHLGIELSAHHRADADAEATARVFVQLAERYRLSGAKELPGKYAAEEEKKKGKDNAHNYHIIFLVENQTGLTNLYKLVSYSHLDHFHRRPRIPRSLLNMHREGLIVGSACEAGELFQAMLKGKTEAECERIAVFYDFLEVQPIGNNGFLIREGTVADDEALRELNCRIVDLADKLNLPCVATGDVHFKEPRDEYFRRIIMAGQKFADADLQAPLFFKTTEDMLSEFSYMGEEKARELVIVNPGKMAQRCEMLKPFPDETCPPIIEGAEEELVSSSFEKAHLLYGDPLPKEVQQRLDRELASITKYGFSVLYVIARKLVLKSLSDGYLVGSRGSVGSSLVAFLCGITEVNALEPHYVCPNETCKHSDFEVDLGKYACGCDMPDKICPICGTNMRKDGFNIPFEVFLGFEGDKVPDIDLNFSGEYQPVAHKYTEELFGEGYVFRAGTISSIKDKTAFGYVKKYFDERGIPARKAEMERLAEGCSGVKRTTGQHPGGVVVVPKDRSIFEFTPIQHPADEADSPIITTHFDFNSLHDRLVKLDILGHDDPTVIRMLQDLTNIDPKTIPLDDEQTMKIFSSTDSLGITPADMGCDVGSFGIPEFGTSFVRQMLVDTRPTTMEELVRISGLSHGTDVWLNNAQDLVRAKTATLSQVICTRDDIMNFLIYCGVNKKLSFSIMENVRKGKGLKPEMEEAMLAEKVPQWYIDSCKKIKYMFPRAHAVAYVMMAFRIAYCKVHHPEAFYAAYFTVRADAFDITLSMGGAAVVRKNIEAISKKGNEASEKEANLQTILEVVLEMYLRGIALEPINLMCSDAKNFIISGEKRLLPPLNSLPGLGTKAAQSIVEARKGRPFTSMEDLQRRSKIGPSTTALLKAAGCLEDVPESDQTTLF